ncbi:MAG: SdpI family protein [Balneolaceae bacterium]
MNILNTVKKEWYVVVIVLLPFFVSTYYWEQLPDTVPTHFNIQGEADDWGPKWMVAVLIPLVGLFTYLMILLLPLIDPKKKIETSQKPVAAIRIFTSVFMTAIYGFVMASALGSQINFASYIIAGVGLLILIVGNYMNSIKPNYFIGVRTPWTLESPEVWKRTHRLTSKVWVVGGFGMMISAFFPSILESAFPITALVFVLAGVPIVYSFMLFKKLESKITDS